MINVDQQRIYAEVIGDPIAHTRSPVIHTFWLEKLGIKGDYLARHVLADDLEAYFQRRRSDPLWRGANVTIPHKEAALRFIDGVDHKASAIGAVNCVYRGRHGQLIGTNTDVDGVSEAIKAANPGPAVVLGNGGAARATFVCLARQQKRQERPEVRILARNPAKAEMVAQSCGLSARVYLLEANSGAFDRASLVINATQLGMDGALPMPAFVLDELEQTAGDALIFDMVYAPLVTPLLRAARAVNRRTSDGLVMLVSQAAGAFEKFFGAVPPRDEDDALRRQLIT